MATVVSVMDRPGWDARTDNIVVVDPRRECLTWIPRDLWCEALGERINVAFKRGQHDALRRALGEHDVSVQHSVCLLRTTVERALADVVVTVPVPTLREFWYPLEPNRRIQEGRKLIVFTPPSEVLQGERIHQWIGARYGPDSDSADFDRLRRQQVFVRILLEQGFPFGDAVAEEGSYSASDDAAFEDLRGVRSTWQFETYDRVVDRVIDGQRVLVDRPPPPARHRARRRAGQLYRGVRRRR